MSVKHYMSIFVDEDMYNTINHVCQATAASKSKIGRNALNVYLGLSEESLSWLDKQAMRTGKNVSRVLEEMICELKY